MVIINHSMTTIVINVKFRTARTLFDDACSFCAIATIEVSYAVNANVVAFIIKPATTRIFIIKDISFVVLNIIPSCAILQVDTCSTCAIYNTMQYRLICH